MAKPAQTTSPADTHDQAFDSSQAASLLSHPTPRTASNHRNCFQQLTTTVYGYSRASNPSHHPVTSPENTHQPDGHVGEALPWCSVRGYATSPKTASQPGGAAPKPRRVKTSAMSTVPPTGIQSGPESVAAFATKTAEPDKEGGTLRYRSVDIENLASTVPYEQVCSLLVDDRLKPACPSPTTRPDPPLSQPPRRRPRSTSDARTRVGLPSSASTSPTSRPANNPARASVMALSFVAQSARGPGHHPYPKQRSTKDTPSLNAS